MFQFLWPWFALLLPVPVLVAWLWPRPRPVAAWHASLDQPSLLHPGLAYLQASFRAGTAQVQRSEWLRLALLALAWVGLVGALMRPQWLEEHSEVVSSGYDLILAVDGSRSMEALDFTVDGRRVSRMQVVKGVLGKFIAGREGDRIGLVMFGDQAYVLSPLTLDGTAVRMLLDDVVPRMAGDATAMGDAIGLAVKKLRERPEGSRVLVLVTDGESTAGVLPPRMAAQLAAANDVRIYAIGVGSKGLVPFMEGGRLTQVRMEIDEKLLQEIAEITAGAYFRATDSHALETIYERIDALEKTEAEARSLWFPTPLYRWPLGAALLALLALGFFPEGRWRWLGARTE